METAQPIRTMAIKLEEGAMEEEGEGCERLSKEEGVEEAEEQLEVTHLPLFQAPHKQALFNVYKLHFICTRASQGHTEPNI